MSITALMTLLLAPPLATAAATAAAACCPSAEYGDELKSPWAAAMILDA